jgi:hypothetical protein
MKKAALRARPSGSGSSTKRAAPPAANGGLEVLRLEVRSLKELVLFQKAKQQLLRSTTSGLEQVNMLRADYLKVVLTLTGTSAGSILLQDNDHRVFRAGQRRVPPACRQEGPSKKDFSSGLRI